MDLLNESICDLKRRRKKRKERKRTCPKSSIWEMYFLKNRWRKVAFGGKSLKTWFWRIYFEWMDESNNQKKERRKRTFWVKVSCVSWLEMEEVRVRARGSCWRRRQSKRWRMSSSDMFLFSFFFLLIYSKIRYFLKRSKERTLNKQKKVKTNTIEEQNAHSRQSYEVEYY